MKTCEGVKQVDSKWISDLGDTITEHQQKGVIGILI